MSTFEASYILLWLVVSVLLIGVVGLYSAFGVIYGHAAPGQHRRELSQTVGPTVGDWIPVPDELVSIDGAPIDRSTSRWLFASANCQPCRGLLQALSELAPEDLIGPTVVVCSDEKEAVRDWGRDIPEWIQLVSDERGELFTRFKVTATPLFVGIVDEHCVVSGPASDRRALDRKNELLADNMPPAIVRVGAV